jgi:predicted deacylase
MTKSRVTPDFDLDAPGKRHGFMRLFHSVHRSAYGFIPFPAGVIVGGPGPTALLVAGNHGDEWEGQVVLSELLQALQPEQVRGRVIILPCANLPASLASTRTSPLDEGNLNRSFPGHADGTATQQWAHYIATELIPLADLVIDLHSGGSSLMYLPCTLATEHDDPARLAAHVDAIRAFGAPHAYLQGRAEGQGGVRTLGAMAESRGILSIATELGGSGTVTPAIVAMARSGVRRVLAHAGLIDPPPEPPAETHIIRIGDADDWTYAPVPGVFEPLALPGDTVQPGQPAARLHTPEAPWQPPAEIAFKRGGLVICRRHPGRAERGDCLFGLGQDWSAPASS